MRLFQNILFRKNEDGFVLVGALLALIVLSLIGIAAMNSANTEKNIAHNINLAEKTFYQADSGVEVGIEMIEWNISCPLGFNNAGLDEANPDPQVFYDIGGVRVADPVLAYRENWNEIPWDPALPVVQNNAPSDGARSIMIPESMAVPVDGAPHTNLAIWGTTTLGEGSAVQMAAGYEGKGKSAAGGGGVINYQDISQALGFASSCAQIRLGWRHLIGLEGECRPY